MESKHRISPRPAGRRSERGHWTMEIVIAAAVLAAGLVVAALLLVKRAPGLAAAGGASQTTSRPTSGPKQAVAAPEKADHAALEHRQEIGRLEERLVGREAALDARAAELETQAEALARRERGAAEAHERHVKALERPSGYSASQAKQLLLKELEDQIRHDSARLVRQIEEETPADADRRARNILPLVMQPLPPPRPACPAAPARAQRRDHGVRRPAAGRRHEGPHDRPRA